MKFDAKVINTDRHDTVTFGDLEIRVTPGRDLIFTITKESDKSLQEQGIRRGTKISVSHHLNVGMFSDMRHEPLMKLRGIIEYAMGF